MTTELQKAFRSARRPAGGIAIIPAQRALANARANLALMAEAQDRKAAAEAQMAEARAIDSRRYAPGMEAARDAQARAQREWSRAWGLLNSGRSIRGNAMRAGHDSDKPGSVFIDDPESYGFRLVGRVAADTPRGPIWDNRGDSGWFDNAYGESFRDGSGLIFGLVYQLPARDGCPRFVPAYGNGDNDGVLMDFASMETGTRDSNCSYDGARGNDAARDAARSADSMAQHVAERAREYDSAWQAGSAWAQAAEELRDARQAALAILKERRTVKGQEGFPALCAAIRAQVRDLLGDIADARARMARLADGDGETDSDYCRNFWTGDSELRGAFNEGAGESVLPA